MGASPLIQRVEADQTKGDLPIFRAGDTVRVHAKIVEGSKERVQVFEGVVIKTTKKAGHANATFTVRKVSYNVGVERTFMLHSPRIEKIEVMRSGKVRRSRLFYLRPLRGKAARIKSKLQTGGVIDYSKGEATPESKGEATPEQVSPDTGSSEAPSSETSSSETPENS